MLYYNIMIVTFIWLTYVFPLDFIAAVVVAVVVVSAIITVKSCMQINDCLRKATTKIPMFHAKDE